MANNSRLQKLNPLVKIILLATISTLVTFDYSPVLPAVYLLLASGFLGFLGNIPFKEVIKKIAPFFLLAVGFFIFTAAARGVNSEGITDVQFWIFHWSRDTILVSLSLSLRILVVAIYSQIFVLTTNPIDFLICLIQYFRFPYKIGYSILAAYRFLPTFQAELNQIRFAHEVRGADEGRSFLSGLLSLKRYMIPMLATAVRRGERIAFAMESKAFGISPKRTFYRTLKMKKSDYFCLFLGLFCIFAVTFGLYTLQLTHFSFAYHITS